MKALPWILLVLASLALIYAFVLLLNGGAALDDARSEVTRLRDRSNHALLIVRKDWIGRDEARVLDLSKEFEQQGMIVGVEGDTFEIGDFIFETQGGVVTKVQYIDRR